VNDQLDIGRYVYIVMSALAGAITALSFMPWSKMRWTEIGMTLFVGSAFALFGVPYLIGDMVKVEIHSLRAICFWTYIGATGANVFLPVIIRRIRLLLERVFGSETEA